MLGRKRSGNGRSLILSICIWAIASSLAGAIADPQASGEDRLALGIEELSRLDLLPKFKQAAKVGMVSSYDRSGGNDDGFSGKHSFLRKE